MPTIKLDYSQKDRNIQNELLAKIQIVVTTMDEIDDIFDKMSEEQSKANNMQQDLIHKFEDYELSDEAYVNIGKKLHECRELRRNWDNVYHIKEVYYNLQERLLKRNTREFFATNIRQTINKLNTEYKNRVLTDEEENELLFPTVHKDAQKEIKKNVKNDNVMNTKKSHYIRLTDAQRESILDYWRQGLKAPEIAEKMGAGLLNVYMIKQQYIKKYGAL